MTTSGGTPEPLVPTGGSRVDDQQRSATLDQLSSAVATGRLSAEEFDEQAELAPARPHAG